MISQELIQTILGRLAESEAKGVSDVGAEQFLDLASKEKVFQHLLYMKGDGVRLIDAEELRYGFMNRNLETVYKIRLTSLGYQALQPELKARAVDQPRLRNNPWLSGSFYLFAVIVLFAVIITAIVVTGSWITLACVVGLVIVFVFIGAFQLRNDDRLSEESFLDLMGLAFKQLPLIRSISTRNGDEPED